MKNIINKRIASRYIIGENDEGFHENKTYSMREWWYYNAFFNHSKSDLKNWSILLSLSINQYCDSIKIILYDDKKNNYGGSYLQKKGELKAKGSCVNVHIAKSFIKGMYPKWDLHFENTGMDNKEIVADLEYKATKQPIWIVKNTGCNTPTSILGYYFVMNCEVKGVISIDNTKYNVKGIGYYDHTWSPLYKKQNKQPDDTERKIKMDTYVWDWIYFHLNNGWNIFAGKIYFSKKNKFSFFMPGSLNFISDENNMMESYFFQIMHKKFQKTSMPNIKTPKEINIKAMKINPLNKYPIKGPLYLDLNYETNNIREFLYGDPPHWGIWDGFGKVSGKLKGFGKEIDLEGFGITEYTNNI